MKAFVDRDACIGCGLCESICPEVFRMDDEGISEVIVDDIPDSLLEAAQDAASQCPAGAIRIE
jgi:ferredoxin